MRTPQQAASQSAAICSSQNLMAEFDSMAEKINAQQAGKGHLLAFVARIQLLDKMMASMPDEATKGLSTHERAQMALNGMHRVNFNTIEEACWGFKAVMSCEQFIQTLRCHLNEATVERQVQCCLIFKYWMETCGSFYQADFSNPAIVEEIEMLIIDLEKVIDNGCLDRLKQQLVNCCSAASQPQVYPQIDLLEKASFKGIIFEELSLWELFLECCGNDVSRVAAELLNQTIRLQATIQSNLFDAEESKELLGKLSNIVNLLQSNITRDIQAASNMNLQVKKYKFYLKLFRASLELGNFFICVAFMGVFIEVRETFAACQEVRKWDQEIESLTFFTGDVGGGLFRNKLLADKNNPYNLTLLSAQLEHLKVELPPLLAEDSVDISINAAYVAAMAAIAQDLVQRQSASTHCKCKTNLFAALLATSASA
jgi:hypothetical protein